MSWIEDLDRMQLRKLSLLLGIFMLGATMYFTALNGEAEERQFVLLVGIVLIGIGLLPFGFLTANLRN